MSTFIFRHFICTFARGMKSVLCIFRATCYSPRMVERDEAILCAVAERLTESGYRVNLIHEEDLAPDTPMPDIVLHMARSTHALDQLYEWSKAGCRVINSPQGVRGVERASLAEWCYEHNIPTPKTWIVMTSAPRVDEIVYPCWVKRCGTCAQSADDVCRADSKEEYMQRIENFRKRHIEKVVVMEHLEGTCVKFYAVPKVGFSYSIPTKELGYDKFALSPTHKETDSKEGYDTQHASFKTSLKDYNYGRYTLLDVFGGDVIIGADGVARLIDLNDWPSFSACRKEAAEAIVQLVIRNS